MKVLLNALFGNKNKEPENHGISEKKERVRKKPISQIWNEQYPIPQSFTAIDFETANSERSSACSFAIAVVLEGEITERKSWLIRPEPFRFDTINSHIHGLKEHDLVKQPNFSQLWPEISTHLQGQHIIAHNTSFDLSVLRSVLDIYNIPYPDFSYSCTLSLSKIIWPELKKHKLDHIAKHFGIEFKHHEALDDAYACAMIANELIKHLNKSNAA